MTKNKFESIKSIILSKDPTPLGYQFKYITEFNCYSDYNEFYEKVWYLDVGFVLKCNETFFNIKIKFEDVSSLKMEITGDERLDIEGFIIRDKSKEGYEGRKKYFVEDYEDDVLEFYCKNFDIISFSEFK